MSVHCPRLMSGLHRCLTMCCGFTYCCGKVFMTLIGPLLATIACSLITFVLISYFYHIYPTLTDPRHFNLSTTTANLITMFGLYLLFITMYHYFSTMFIDPGFPPENETWSIEQKSWLAMDPEIRETGSQYRYCKKCDRIKPMRTHHCNICNNPWVNNCVGYRNYRHFVLFTLYLFFVSVFYLLMGYPIVYRVLAGYAETFSLLLSIIVSLSANIASLLFIIWNSFLLCTNQSTIEFYGNYFDRDGRGGGRDGNVYNMGIAHNIREALGPSVWRTILLPIHDEPPGDGCIYPMNKGRGFPLPQLLNGDHVV